MKILVQYKLFWQLKSTFTYSDLYTTANKDIWFHMRDGWKVQYAAAALKADSCPNKSFLLKVDTFYERHLHTSFL